MWRILLAALLIGWIARPLALAVPEPLGCAKECCVRDGVCCCLAEHDAADEEPTPQHPFLKPSKGEQCAPPSAASPSSSVSFALQTRGQPQVAVEPNASRLLSTGLARFALSEYCLKRSAPRAPPATLPLF